MIFEVTKSRHTVDEWRVEAIDSDEDGAVYVALFSGPQSRERAEEYAAWKNAGEDRTARRPAPRELKDREYRTVYAEGFLDTSIATQIKVLREERELTQAQLAELAGMKQSRISTMEDVSYSNWSIKTLKRLARAFDLPLFVSWGTYGQLLDHVDKFSRANLSRTEAAPGRFSQDFQTDPLPKVGGPLRGRLG